MPERKLACASPARPSAKAGGAARDSSESLGDAAEYRPRRNYRKERGEARSSRQRASGASRASVERAAPKVLSADLREGGIRVAFEDGWVAETVSREARGKGGDVFMRFRAPKAPVFSGVLPVLGLLRQQAAEDRPAAWLERRGAPRDLKLRLSTMKRLVSRSLRLQLEQERDSQRGGAEAAGAVEE